MLKVFVILTTSFTFSYQGDTLGKSNYLSMDACTNQLESIYHRNTRSPHLHTDISKDGKTITTYNVFNKVKKLNNKKTCIEFHQKG